MSEISIHPATANDAHDVGLILSNWIDATPWLPRMHSRDDEQKFAGDLVARGWVHVAKEGAQVVGFLARDKTEIHGLYLTPSACGQGTGRALLGHAKECAEHLMLWVFERNEGAQRFYERAGFREIRRSDGATNDEGLPDIRYEWRRQNG